MESDQHQTTLMLYTDSTFIEVVKEAHDHYTFSGTWRGSIKEGSSFTTHTTHKGYDTTTLFPAKTYTIHQGKAILVEYTPNQPPPNIEKLDTHAGRFLSELLDFERIKQVEILNQNGPHYLSQKQFKQILEVLKTAKSLGGLLCKPSGPCLTFELEDGRKIQACVCDDLINFESYLYGSFKMQNSLNFHNF
jgi:hypothetical protein